MKLNKLLCFIIFLIPVLASGQSSEAAPGDTVKVEMGSARFIPSKVEVTVGQTVQWTNTTLVAQTVTADSAFASAPDNVQLPEGAQPFHSGRMNPGGIYSYTFTVPGTYRYFSIPYQGASMVGEIVVVPQKKENQ